VSYKIFRKDHIGIFTTLKISSLLKKVVELEIIGQQVIAREKNIMKM